MENNALDFDLALSVGEYFRLNSKQMNQILQEVNTAVSKWKEVATTIGIARNEQLIMQNAFNLL
jgi:serine/threonine-protein kinase HipA